MRPSIQCFSFHVSSTRKRKIDINRNSYTVLVQQMSRLLPSVLTMALQGSVPYASAKLFAESQTKEEKGRVDGIAAWPEWLPKRVCVLTKISQCKRHLLGCSVARCLFSTTTLFSKEREGRPV